MPAALQRGWSNGKTLLRLGVNGNLSQAVIYEAKVRACDSNWENCSAGSNTKKGATRIDRVKDIGISDSTISSATLEWGIEVPDAGSHGCYAIGYSGDQNASKPDTYITDPPDVTSYPRAEVTGLAKGKSYRFFVETYVAESCAEGQKKWHGPWTHIDGLTTIVAATPTTMKMSRPFGLDAVSNDGEVSLSWEIPEEEQAEGESFAAFSSARAFSRSRVRAQSQDTETGTEYEVSYRAEGDNWSEGGTQTETETAASVANLENGIRYEFRVRATGDEGAGEWSEMVTTTPGEAADRPTDVSIDTDADTAWKTLDLSFTAPPEGSGHVAGNSQYRVLGMKKGASWTDWTTVAGTSVSDGRVSGSSRTRSLAIGRIYEVEVRWCGDTQSDDTCSEASDTVYGATPASAPTNAEAAQADPTDALTLSWSISPIGGKKNLQAAYELGYATDTEATEPTTRVPAADVPAFGATEAQIGGL